MVEEHWFLCTHRHKTQSISTHTPWENGSHIAVIYNGILFKDIFKFVEISPKYFSNDPVGNVSIHVHINAWPWTGNKPHSYNQLGSAQVVNPLFSAMMTTLTLMIASLCFNEASHQRGKPYIYVLYSSTAFNKGIFDKDCPRHRCA